VVELWPISGGTAHLEAPSTTRASLRGAAPKEWVLSAGCFLHPLAQCRFLGWPACWHTAGSLAGLPAGTSALSGLAALCCAALQKLRFGPGVNPIWFAPKKYGLPRKFQHPLPVPRPLRSPGHSKLTFLEALVYLCCTVPWVQIQQYSGGVFDLPVRSQIDVSVYFFSGEPGRNYAIWDKDGSIVGHPGAAWWGRTPS